MPRMTQSGPAFRGRRQERSAKHSAWRKNKRFGQAYGGDGVGRSCDYIPSHRLPLPAGDREPVLIEDRPHCDYVFPVTGQEAMERLRQLPANHIEGITHVWMRRMGPGDSGRPLGSYSYGLGYAVIVLYPWPRDLRWFAGAKKVHRFWARLVSRFGGRLERRNGKWYAKFTEDGARRFFLDDLILHEVGHHNDWRDSSPANHKQEEEFAIQYAAEWARRLAAPTPPKVKLCKARRRKLLALLQDAYPYCAVALDIGLTPQPHPDLTVSFELLDRHGRARSQRVWLRAEAIDHLTIEGLKVRVDRANQYAQGRAEQ